MCNIDQVPNELLEYIFYYVDQASLRSQCIRVCSNWKQRKFEKNHTQGLETDHPRSISISSMSPCHEEWRPSSKLGGTTPNIDP